MNRLPAISPGIFAPSVDMSAAAAPDLPALATAAGAKHLVLGSVDEDWAGGCHPTWGGLSAMQAAGAGTYRRDNVAALQLAGDEAIVSFGGRSGIELADLPASIARDKAIVSLQQSAAAAGRRPVVGFSLPSALTAWTWTPSRPSRTRSTRVCSSAP